MNGPEVEISQKVYSKYLVKFQKVLKTSAEAIVFEKLQEGYCVSSEISFKNGM